MAREIITRILCDVCNASDDGPSTEAETVAIVIDGESREIDLCSEHVTPIRGLQAMLEEHGRHIPKRGRPKAATDGVTSASGRKLHPNEIEQAVCPVKDCGYTASRKKVTSHCRSVHGKSLAELEGKPLKFVCDVDGCGQRFAIPQALGLHRFHTHGIPGVAKEAV